MTDIQNAMKRLHMLAKAARPIDDDDWGSNHQIAAQNFFFDELEKIVGSKALEPFACMKASGDELIDEALKLLD